MKEERDFIIKVFKVEILSFFSLHLKLGYLHLVSHTLPDRSVIVAKILRVANLTAGCTSRFLHLSDNRDIAEFDLRVRLRLNLIVILLKASNEAKETILVEEHLTSSRVREDHHFLVRLLGACLVGLLLLDRQQFFL